MKIAIIIKNKIREYRYSLSLKIALYFGALLFLVLFLTSNFSYMVITNTIIDKTNTSNYNYLKIVDNTLKSTINEVKKTVLLIQRSGVCSLIENLNNEYDYKRIENITQVKNVIFSIKFTKKELYNILIITKNNTFSVQEDLSTVKYDAIINERFNHIVTSNNPTLLKQADYKNTPYEDLFKDSVVFAQRLVSSTSGSELGIIYIMIQPESIIIQDRDIDLYVLDSYASILWTLQHGYNVDKLRESSLKITYLKEGKSIINIDGVKYIASYFPSTTNGWKLLGLTDYKKIKTISNLPLYIVMLAFFYAIITFLGIVKLTGLIITPIRHLKEKMENFKRYYTNAAVDELKSEKKRFMRRFSIKTKLMLVGGGSIAFSTTLFLLIIYLTSEGLIKNAVKSSIDKIVYQTAIYANYTLNNYDQISLNALLDKNIQKLLIMKNRKDDIVSQYLKSQQTVSQIIANKFILEEGIEDIKIYDNKGELYYSTKNFGNTDNIYKNNLNYYKKLNSSIGEVVWVNTENTFLGTRIFASVRRIRNVSLPDELYSFIGYLKIEFQEQILEEKFLDALWNMGLESFIIDNKGIIISSINKELIGKKIEDQFMRNVMQKRIISKNKDIDVSYADINASGWTLITKVPMDLIIQENYKILTYNYYIILIVIGCIFMITNNISNNIIKPIQELSIRLSNLESGNLVTIYQERHGDEVEELNQQFNKMIKHLNELVNEIIERKVYEKELENRKKEAELLAYQSQMNPHFLYNTFLSVNMLIKSGYYSKSMGMIKDLGILFDKCINRGDILVDIKDELDHVNAYLSIQQTRFPNLDVKIKVDENIYQNKIIKLTLQPIVENSVYHGLELKKGKGSIYIRGKKMSNLIKICVADNGEGIGRENLKEINLNLDKCVKSSHIGLQNVNERLKLYFGDQYGIKIRSKIKKGTLVSIKIPLIALTN